MNKVRKKIKQQEKKKSNTKRTGYSPYLLISEHECYYGVWAFVEENDLSHVVSYIIFCKRKSTQLGKGMQLLCRRVYVGVTNLLLITTRTKNPYKQTNKKPNHHKTNEQNKQTKKKPEKRLWKSEE